MVPAETAEVMLRKDKVTMMRMWKGKYYETEIYKNAGVRK